MLIGAQLAQPWGLGRGDEIEIATISYNLASGDVGEPCNQRYVVAGIFRSGDNETDQTRVYFDRPVLAKLLGRTEYFTHILVKLIDYERDKQRSVEEFYPRLAAAGLVQGPGSGFREVQTWEQQKDYFLRAVENERFLMALMLSLVMVVAGFTVYALLSMMVLEKRRDIGILCALGATPGGIMSVFVLIGFWQALFGALIGAVLGVWGALKVDALEQWLSRTMGFQIFDRNVYYFDHIPAIVEPVWVAVIVLGAFVCTLVFAALPAIRAARMNPIDALRYE